MVIIRNLPNTHTVESVTFHPGAQFISDTVYHKTLKDNTSFKEQLKSFMEIVVAAKPLKDGKIDGKEFSSLAESVAVMPEELAVRVVEKTVDYLDIQEIIKLDKRRAVVAAATKQVEERQAVLNNLAPKLAPGGDKSIRLPGFDDAKDFLPGAK